MADTTFTDYTTPVVAAWLNDVNDHVYNDTPVSPATAVHDAALISNTPAGGLVATTVQAAIDELDTKVAAHISDTTDAHAASAITNTPAGNIAATTVQAAINELDTEKAALAGATFTGPVNTARGTVAMHATTMDLWSQPNVIDGTGSAVTITAIANAPQAGAVRILYPITGTVITHGATFSVQGGASYTTKAGDALVIEAVTTSTYNVWIQKKNARTVHVVTGSRAAATDYTNSSGGEMLVSVWCNNTATSGGTGHLFLVDGAAVTQQLYAGAGLASNNASSATTYEVPDGSIYRVELVSSTLSGWIEQNY